LTLTARQSEVAHLAAEGHTIDEIASTLGISPSTTRTHLEAIKRKLGVPRKRHIAAALKALGEKAA